MATGRLLQDIILIRDTFPDLSVSGCIYAWYDYKKINQKGWFIFVFAIFTDIISIRAYFSFVSKTSIR